MEALSVIHYFPLEAYENRYTGYLDRMIRAYLDDAGLSYQLYKVPAYGLAARPGQFFDPAGAIRNRSLQIALLANANVEDGDVVFFSDILMPGVETVGWMAHLAGVKLRIRGLLHAGSYGPYDAMHSAADWAGHHENAVFALMEEAYLGSFSHKAEVHEQRIVAEKKLVVTGHVVDDQLPKPETQREPIVVFTGRLSEDKQPWLFRALAAVMEDEAEFVVALEQRLSKTAYYELLSRAKVVVSFALQETFGVGVQEAVALGCVPVVPNRLCYVEQFDAAYRFSTFPQAVRLVKRALDGKLPVPAPVDCSGAIERWFRL